MTTTRAFLVLTGWTLAQALAQTSGDGFGLNTGRAHLPVLTQSETRSISPENPTGEKGKGGMAIPNPADPDLAFSAAASDLGQGWKVRPFLKPKAGQPLTLMDLT